MQATCLGCTINRIAVATGYGDIVAEVMADCDFSPGETVSGVMRDHGTQHWTGESGQTTEVYVEGFDCGRRFTQRFLGRG